MAGLSFAPDPTESKVLDGLVARGLARDRVAAARIALLIAGAATGILEAAPTVHDGAAGHAADRDGDDGDAELEAAAGGKKSVSSAVDALKNMRKAKRR